LRKIEELLTRNKIRIRVILTIYPKNEKTRGCRRCEAHESLTTTRRFATLMFLLMAAEAAASTTANDARARIFK
jgi:hypothetical protein